MNKYMQLVSQLAVPSEGKMVLLVADGLGGLHFDGEDATPLEKASTPVLDSIAPVSSLGLLDPIYPGVTPGSGPAHLGLFGYDPLEYEVDRGALSAAGVDFPMEEGDVAARANFATVDAGGNVVDRRAGRIPTEKCKELTALLQKNISIEGVEVFVRPEKEHRAAVIFRGEGLSPRVYDTDPQKTGVPPAEARPLDDSPEAQRTASIVAEFSRQAAELLEGEEKANYILLRGLAPKPDLPSMEDLYGIRCCAVATYPMYRGLARLVGMEVLSAGETVEDEFRAALERWDEYDYFFIHVKKTDSYGEDGNYTAKVGVIEQVDAALPLLLEKEPAVFAFTGDHSTPALLASHSWHPVPVLLKSPVCRRSRARRFTEHECAVAGNLGRLPSMCLLPLMLANAGRLKKFGA